MSRKAFTGLMMLALVSALAGGCAAPGPKSHGAQLFKTCSPCHGVHGEGSLPLRAPAIAGLPDWYLTTEITKFQKDIRGAHPDDMEGHRMRPMARILYHTGDVEAVVGYISSMKAQWMPPTFTANATAGQQRYATVCIACHGALGQGAQAMGAPPITGQADWYLAAQLKKFKSGMRGAHPLDTQGAMMRAMSSTLTDTLAMRDVVAYIKTLPH